MHSKMDRTQTRFIEDPDRFDIPTKPKRNTHKDDVQPETGHQSTNPGPWVTEIALGLTEATEEQRESVAAILESYYRLRPRYVTLRYPIDVVVGQLWEKELPATEFREETVLDNKSLCFGVAVREPEDNSAAFKYMEQPHVLDGADLQQYLADKQSLVSYSNDKEHEREQGKIERKSKRKRETPKERRLRLKAEATAKTKVAPAVSDAEMLAHYSHWYENPSDHSKAKFWEILHHFLSRLTRLTRKDDDLHKLGLSDDFQMEFMLSMMERLERKEEIDTDGETKKGTKRVEDPAHYIRRAWKRRRISELKEQAKAATVTVQIDRQVEDAAGESECISLDDPQGYKAWARVNNAVVEQHAVVEPTKEEYKAACEEKLNTLDPALADLVGMVLAQQTQSEIGKRLRISQQAVSKRVKKATDLIKAMPDAVVTK